MPNRPQAIVWTNVYLGWWPTYISNLVSLHGFYVTNRLHHWKIDDITNIFWCNLLQFTHWLTVVRCINISPAMTYMYIYAISFNMNLEFDKIILTMTCAGTTNVKANKAFEQSENCKIKNFLRCQDAVAATFDFEEHKVLNSLTEIIRQYQNSAVGFLMTIINRWYKTANSHQEKNCFS